MHHSPATTAKSAGPSVVAGPASTPASGATVEKLRGTVRADAAKAAQLQKYLAALRKEANERALAGHGAAAGKVAAVPTTGTATVASGGSGPVQAAATITGRSGPAQPPPAYTPPATTVVPVKPVAPAPAPVPAPVVQQPAPAPPPTNTTTGASGRKK
jgi:hypothetical protein